ncbi:MAG: hypothetical protein A3H49_10020 [Nitrospirae bacterium RIFCSPLOWO2_02_FULL_62_14]|nr:MAG: hypothetical protein A3H49_10020 [Nitrospirae bacterium RIFCSPLOWO2_02_FULL_62_14]OGW70705.1 MAG: hypothetical protein A3A88_08475 [Nitrospirae bacterium RIFCSPLOWO2_01_FULL_62_17]
MIARHLTFPFLCLSGLALALSACGPASNRYALIEESLRAGNVQRADQIVEEAHKDYDAKSQVLYRMDRGMTLHLAGRYEESTSVLEKAEQMVEELYTRRISTHTKAFLYNDTELPFEGAPYEQVMLNVLKALNYAVTGNLQDALVEARRVDHRLNVLADQVGDKPDAYKDDGLARYLSGILYEAAGELNDAFIAYRKAYDAYLAAQTWSRTPPPPMLRTDLLRITDALHVTDEHAQYRQAFGDTPWQPPSDPQQFAQVVVVSYNGAAPRKEDQFLDLPISLDALRLVLVSKQLQGGSSANSREARAVESVLYGLNGRVVRVALPRLVPRKTAVAIEQVSLGGADRAYGTHTELVQDISALAAKQFSDQFNSVAVKAVARAAVKYMAAEGVARSTRAAAGRDATAHLIALLVGSLAKALAISTEEADKRIWQTLPDEIHVARLWVPPGSYELFVRPIGKGGGPIGRETVRAVTLRAGETRFFTERVMP